MAVKLHHAVTAFWFLWLCIANSVPSQVPSQCPLYPSSPSLASDHSFLFLLLLFTSLRSKFQLQILALFPLAVSFLFLSCSSQGRLSLSLLSGPLHSSFSFSAVCSGITESTQEKNIAAVTSWPAAEQSYTCTASLVQQPQGTRADHLFKLFVF